MVSKKNLVKREFPYSNTFDHEGLAVVNTMRDLTSGVFEHLEITSHMDMVQRVAKMQQIMRGSELKKIQGGSVGV